jgi:hypothetical protein
MASSPLPFASIENKFLRLDYLTTTGPRITGLYAQGVEGNLLAETPDVHWPTPHGEFHLRGGHRLWIAPEDYFYACPEDGVSVVEEKDKVILSSPVDASGLEKEISFYLDENCVRLSHRITWHGDRPIEFAPWAITQLRLGSMAILPQSSSEGLEPNRNIVLWPYSQIHDKRFELYDDMILLHGRGTMQAFKIGNFNKHGWIACTLGKALFVKRFSFGESQSYPDMGCNVEVYVKDVCVEVETLGPLAKLNQNESVTHEEIWEVFTDTEYSATIESAREISERLSSNNIRSKNGKQNYFS